MNCENPNARFLEYEDNHGCFAIAGLLIGGLASGAASGLFGLLGSKGAAGQAADAEKAALGFEKQIYQNEQNQLLPFITGGTDVWKQLLAALGTPSMPGILTESPAEFGQLPNVPPQYDYVAPTSSMFQTSPGYEFQKKQGIEAIQNAAGGKTGILGGNTMQALETFGTGLANQDWWNFLKNYQDQYNTKYAANTQDYWNRYKAAGDTQQNLWNRFAGPAQVGLGAIETGGQLANQSAGLIGNQYNQIGQTNAAGTLGQFNALSNIFSGAFGGGGGGGMGGGFNLAQLFGGGGAAPYNSGIYNLAAGGGGSGGGY